MGLIFGGEVRVGAVIWGLGYFKFFLFPIFIRQRSAAGMILGRVGGEDALRLPRSG